MFAEFSNGPITNVVTTVPLTNPLPNIPATTVAANATYPARVLHVEYEYTLASTI